jgi:aromatic-L-amino-acid decarboxylase
MKSPSLPSKDSFDFTPVGLEPTTDEMQQLLRICGDRVIEHLGALGRLRASDTEDQYQAAQAVVEPLPEKGQAVESVLELFFERVLPKGFNTASPGTLSHVTGGGLFHSAVADFIALATNPYVGYFAAAPGCAQIDVTVARWFCDMLGLPNSAGGILTSGASMASLTAVVTARTLRLGEDFLRGTLYASDQVHESVRKAVRVAGLPMRNLRIIPSDDQCRFPPMALTEAIARDRRAGFTPFLIVGTAGTTDTGVVDDLNGLADVAAGEKLWLHVDAAYGGFFALTERGKKALAGIERADFVALDPHKSLFLPFGTGCLLARSVADLEAAHLTHSEYLDGVIHLGEEGGVTNSADLSLEMTRDFRGMRVWFPLKLLGTEPFRRCLDEKLDLARWFARELRSIEGVEVVAEPQLSVVVFRVVRPEMSPTELARMNQRILQAINARGRVHLSETSVKGRYAIRLSVLAFRAHQEQVKACLDDFRDAMNAETKTM